MALTDKIPAPKESGKADCPSASCSVVEVRINGKLHDLWLEGPEHAVRNALMDGAPYQEARVVANPRGYDFGFLDDLISSSNAKEQTP